MYHTNAREVKPAPHPANLGTVEKGMNIVNVQLYTKLEINVIKQAILSINIDHPTGHKGKARIHRGYFRENQPQQ